MGTLASACAATSLASPADAATGPAADRRRRFPDAPDEPLLNVARAVEVMQSEGVDFLVCSDPVNVYYLTNHRIVSNSLGMDGGAYASFGATGRDKPALITSSFSYYLSSDDSTIPSHVDLRLFSSPAAPDVYESLSEVEDIVSAPATQGYLTPSFDHAPWRAFERKRRATISAAAAEMAASSQAALLRAVTRADLPHKTVAVDDVRLIPLIERGVKDVRIVDGERLLRRIRLEKSPAEMTLVRYAAAENAAAALSAAKAVAHGATFLEMRAEFAKSCGARLLTPEYLLIDGVFAPLTRATFERGRAFLIDGVSHCGGYHGDYGRTVCIGEPDRRMQRIVGALAHVWDRLLPALKTGVTYSDIVALGQKLFAETRVDAGFVVGPHAVGLHHTDEPGAAEFSPFAKDDLTLRKDMVLSVDMPVLGSGLGGTAHLEDLVRITDDGPELLNPGSDRLIVV